MAQPTTAPIAAAPAPAPAPTAPPVLIPRLQLSSWGAATEDEQAIYGAKPRLSHRQTLAAAKQEAALASAATTSNGRSSGGGQWSPHTTSAHPRSSTSPSPPVSQLHLSPGRRVSVSPSGRGHRSSVSPSGRTLSSNHRATTAGLSPRGNAGTGAAPRATADTAGAVGYSPRGGNSGASPRGATAGSSPRGAPPGTQQRFYSHALRQTPQQPAPQPQQHPSPRSPLDSRSHTTAPAGRLGDASPRGSPLSTSAAGDDLLRRLSELEVDLRARLHSLHVEFEQIKDVRAHRDHLQDQLDNLDAALTSFPFASEIRIKLLHILRANGTAATDTAATAAAANAPQRRSELRQTEPLPDPSPSVLSARSAAADSALVHTAPESGGNPQRGASVPASAVADPVRQSSAHHQQHAQSRPPTAPVPVALFALPSLPAAESTSAVSAVPFSGSGTLRPDESSHQVESEPKLIRRSVGAAHDSQQHQPPPQQPPQMAAHPHLVSSLSSSPAASVSAAPSASVSSSSLTSSSSIFPVEYAPLETAPSSLPLSDDPLDKLLVFPTTHNTR